MAETASGLATATAIVGLIGSLLGNWVQYQTVNATKTELQQKDVELRQAQEKLNAAREAEKRRNDIFTAQLQLLETRIRSYDEEIRSARRDQTAVAFAFQKHPELAAQKARAISQVIEKAEEARRVAQAELDQTRLKAAGCKPE